MYTLLLLTLSIAPSFVDKNFKWEESSGMKPKEGDNFKVANRPAVFKLIDGKKHQYLTESSFHSYNENKPFDTPYELGGILLCDKSVVDAIPHGKYMPFRPGMKYLERNSSYESMWANVFRIDKLFHFLAYFVYSILILLTLIFMYESVSMKQYIGLFIFSLLFGFGLEIAQYLTAAYRDPEMLDVLFNSLGVIAGSYFFFLNERRLLSIINDIQTT